MAEQIVYEVGMKDALTPKLREAEEGANRLEGSLDHVREGAMQIGEAFGIAFGAYKLIEFIKSSGEVFEKLEQANAQIEAGLKSTKGSAGETMEMLEASQQKFRDSTNYSKSSLADMQAQLLSFGNVTKSHFDEISQATLNIAARTGDDIHTISLQMGKAFDDPIKGLGSLHRYGVDFTNQQKKQVEILTEHGHLMQAQAVILQGIQTYYEGSAEAARKANPFGDFDESVEALQIDLGELISELKEKLGPVLSGIANGFKNTIDWMKQHHTLMKDIGVAIGITAGAFAIYKTAMLANIAYTQLGVLWEGIQYVSINVLGDGFFTASVGAKVLAAAQWALNAAWKDNPVGLIITGLATLTAAVIYCWEHFKFFREVVMSVWEVIKEFGRIVADVFMGVYHAIHGAFTFNAKEMTSGFSEATSAFAEQGFRMAKAAQKGWQEGSASFDADNPTSPTKSLIPDKTGAKPKKTGDDQPKEPKTKATGTKNISIKIDIKELVHEFNVNTTNIRESVGKIKDLVAGTLVAAVNDSQIVAGE